eukprot:NODE_7499_length_771_cov_53.888889_g6888_i0.p1 GENE.NODE_7499_length_771_cov_53.888889_g6888_i0~~NODE_7499_length_771_cov_53.888889_g6888_i0.p1  ORF type:complete len:211 (+),score=24.77 NODE_7499_length_771_cov_53.888889_g6888_i0:79-711(+)
MSDTYKICLLGEGRVGKTSLVRRYTVGEYSDTEQSTVQANMFTKKTVTVDDRKVSIAIWDTAGQERFHALGPIYYRDAQGALLVYDITDYDTFKRVQHWIKELKSVVGPDIDIVVAGNKCDLERNRQVTQEEASHFCNSVGAHHFLTSAKLPKNVNESFQELTKMMVQTRSQKSGPTHKQSSTAKRAPIRIEDEPSTTQTRGSKEKSKCC